MKKIKEACLTFLIVLATILIFTFIDYLAHLLSSEYSVPTRYFTNKIIYGTIIGFLTLIIFKKQKPLLKSIIFSAAVSVILQIRYYIEGYPKDFVFLFLGIHFIILIGISITLFKMLQKKKIKYLT